MRIRPVQAASLKTGALLALLFAALLASCAATPSDGSDATPIDLRVMSFNIRYGTAEDGENRWENRRDLVVETIRASAPDLLGIQECLDFQAEFLRNHLPEYEFVGVGRNDGVLDGEMAAIFFRRDRFEKIEEGHFWLSETPDVPGSRSWDAALPRMVSWVRLRDSLTADEVVFLNTHFDHVGSQARLESARLLQRRAIEIADGAPILITGDFNAPARPGDGQPYDALLFDADADLRHLFDTYRVRFPEPAAHEGTFGGFRGETEGPRIDWIIMSRHFDVIEAGIDRSSVNGRYPSDHYPVTAVVQCR